MRVYVAGPITLGCRPQNIRVAILAGERLRQEGLAPYVPHVNELWALVTPVEEEEWLELDFEWLAVCDALLRLPGESAGSDREEKFARLNGIPVFHTIEGLLAWARNMFPRAAPPGEYPSEATRICEECQVKWARGSACWMCGRQGFLAQRGIKVPE